jgi:hypothetical protein
MTIFDYTAYAEDDIHSTQYGEVEANTFKEAEEKIKTLFTYPIRAELSILIDSGSEERSEE